MSLHRLLPLFERARALDQPLVLATVIRTGGSTYAKPGAQMLIAADGEYAGLLSGGCLEGDLREHARAVAASGSGRIVSYDLRSTTDQLFGLGAGCEGAMDVLLTRVSAHEQLAAAALHGRGRPARRCRIASPSSPRASDSDTAAGLSLPSDGEAAPAADDALLRMRPMRRAGQHADPRRTTRHRNLRRRPRTAAAPAVVRRRAGRASRGGAGLVPRLARHGRRSPGRVPGSGAFPGEHPARGNARRGSGRGRAAR